MMFQVDEIRSSSDCWLGIHEKMTKHAKWRHTHSKNRRKHSPVVPVIASSHAYVPWMCVEQQIALFQHHPWPEKTSVHVIKLSLSLSLSLSLKQTHCLTQAWVRVSGG
jgi:hypothetical protein